MIILRCPVLGNLVKVAVDTATSAAGFNRQLGGQLWEQGKVVPISDYQGNSSAPGIFSGPTKPAPSRSRTGRCATKGGLQFADHCQATARNVVSPKPTATEKRRRRAAIRRARP